jgi:hypothetical protein
MESTTQGDRYGDKAGLAAAALSVIAEVSIVA